MPKIGPICLEPWMVGASLLILRACTLPQTHPPQLGQLFSTRLSITLFCSFPRFSFLRMCCTAVCSLLKICVQYTELWRSPGKCHLLVALLADRGHSRVPTQARCASDAVDHHHHSSAVQSEPCATNHHKTTVQSEHCLQLMHHMLALFL